MSSDPWVATRGAFAEAARWFVSESAAAADSWQLPGLGEWSVLDLVGHTSRALLTVESYLGSGPTAVEVPSALDYSRRMLGAAGDPAAVAQRGRDAGAALGSDPAAAVALIAERVLPLVQAASCDALVGTPFGGRRLVDYLPTRTFELTVHTCDIATALGRPVRVPGAAAVASFAVLAELASTNDLAGDLLLAATGRTGLPPGFTVL
ncbi:MAG: maleylpyruvate isomerase N-terminal domain-containing protein [Nocardioidaceae bacterium]